MGRIVDPIPAVASLVGKAGYLTSVFSFQLCRFSYCLKLLNAADWHPLLQINDMVVLTCSWAARASLSVVI